MTAPVFAPLPTTPGGWPCIVADPPWSFRDKGSRAAPDQRKKRRKRKGYKTLPLEQIQSLGVRDVAAPDALLFLWTTSAHLVDGSATAVCRAWGFEPKTTIVWVKARWRSVAFALVKALATLLLWAPRRPVEAVRAARGFLREAAAQLQGLVLQPCFGHYTRGAHELVVVAARGRACSLVQDRGVPSVVVAPRPPPVDGESHSRKPEAFRDLVDRLTGGKPVLELFARTERRGWRAWGNEVPPYHVGDGCPNCGSTDTITGRGGWLLDCRACGAATVDRSPEVRTTDARAA